MYKASKNSALAAMAAVMAFGGLPILATAAHAEENTTRDPNCAVSASGSPGRESLTINVTKNPCGHQVRAYTKCITSMGISSTKTGSVVKTGKSKVDCGTAMVDGRSGTWGHDVNVPGQGWTRYPH